MSLLLLLVSNLVQLSLMGYSAANVSGGAFIGCITWYDKLVDLREFASGGQDFYIRVDSVELANYSRKSKRSYGYIKVLVLLLVSAALIVLVILTYWLLMKKNRGIAQRTQEGISLFSSKNNNRGKSVHGASKGYEPESDEIGKTTDDVKLYSLSTIVAATENFSVANKVGEGGFGSVYKKWVVWRQPEHLVHAAWLKRAPQRYSDLVSKARKQWENGRMKNRIGQEVWLSWIENWKSEEFKAKSKIKKENRMAIALHFVCFILTGKFYFMYA